MTNSKKLFYLTDEGNEFQYLVKHDLASGERKIASNFDACQYGKIC